MRRPAVAVLTALVAGLLSFVALPATAASWSPAAYSARLLSLVNDARANAGLPALELASGTTTVATDWSAQMASTRTLAHNPDLRHQLETHGSANWTAYGENVGEGDPGAPDRLFRAYWNSPEHRANILTRAYRFVGVATVFSGRTSWNTFDFVDRYASGGQTTAQPATRPAHHATTKAPTATSTPTTRPKPTASTAAAPSAPAASTVAAPQRDPKHTPGRAHNAPRRHHAGHHAAHQRPAVRGLTTHSPRPLPDATGSATEATPVSALAPAASIDLTPHGRSSRAVAVAVAVLLLVATSRRWMLSLVPAAARRP